MFYVKSNEWVWLEWLPCVCRWGHCYNFLKLFRLLLLNSAWICFKLLGGPLLSLFQFGCHPSFYEIMYNNVQIFFDAISHINLRSWFDGACLAMLYSSFYSAATLECHAADPGHDIITNHSVQSQVWIVVLLSIEINIPKLRPVASYKTLTDYGCFLPISCKVAWSSQINTFKIAAAATIFIKNGNEGVW